jgi:hypothetical protein
MSLFQYSLIGYLLPGVAPKSNIFEPYTATWQLHYLRILRDW